MSALRGNSCSTGIYCACPFCLKSNTLLHMLWESEKEGFWATCSRCNLSSCSGFCFPTSTRLDRPMKFSKKNCYEEEQEESVWDSMIVTQPNSPRSSSRDVDEDVEDDDYGIVRGEVDEGLGLEYDGEDVEDDYEIVYNEADDGLEYDGDHDEDDDQWCDVAGVEKMPECFLVPNTRVVIVGGEVIPECFLVPRTVSFIWW